jgi:hypothetical protein
MEFRYYKKMGRAKDGRNIDFKRDTKNYNELDKG